MQQRKKREGEELQAVTLLAFLYSNLPLHTLVALSATINTITTINKIIFKMFKQVFAFLAVLASAQAFAPISQNGM